MMRPKKGNGARAPTKWATLPSKFDFWSVVQAVEEVPDLCGVCGQRVDKSDGASVAHHLTPKHLPYARPGRGDWMIDRMIRCRNYAEELRIVAEDTILVQNREALLHIAFDYERMAETYEAIVRFRQAASDAR